MNQSLPKPNEFTAQAARIVQGLKVCQAAQFVDRGRQWAVRRINRNTWMLSGEGEPRVRFGTLPEIRSDVAHLMEFGVLPVRRTAGC